MRASKSQPREFPGLVRRIIRSVFPEPFIPHTESERKRYLLKNLVLHFRPATVPEKTLRFTLTWGLGGMAVTLVLLQFGTGILLKFVFEPAPMVAYGSIQSLQNEVLFGQLIRNLHHWSANLLVLVVFLHMLRVFFTGAFHPPRQFNWLIGWTMFGAILLANLTGYLLPYDQLAYWAVTVTTGMLEYVPIAGLHLQSAIRGGTQIGPATMRIFFAIHTAVVPAALVPLMGFHFWRIRKSGGLVVPRKREDEPPADLVRVPSLPNLLLRELVTALALIAGVLVVSILFNAPLEEPANPGLSPNPTKAPWYFGGLQELLLHIHPTFAVFVIPLIMTIGLALLPYLNYEADTGGIWFASNRGRRMAAIAAITGLVLTPLTIAATEFFIEPRSPAFAERGILGNGMVPALFLVGAFGGFYWTVKRKFSASNNEAIQAVFALAVSSLVVLTVVGVWFRGEGMALTWPWR